MSAARIVLTRCERLVDRLVAESTPARRAAAALEGKSMIVEVSELAVRCSVDNGRISLSLDGGRPADVSVHATPFELARLARAASADELKTARARVDGDIHVAERFAELARLARPEVEDELSRWIGDIPAHEAGKLARRLRAHAAGARRALERDAAEYLQEERRVLPAPLEVAAFTADVDRLRDDVERAEARLARIAAALGSRR